MATVVSLINMKGGVGKSTLTFNFAWYSAWFGNLKVLAIDLDPQANLSQYFLGAERYLELISTTGTKTIVEVFEQHVPDSLELPLGHSEPVLPGPGQVDGVRAPVGDRYPAFDQPARDQPVEDCDHRRTLDPDPRGERLLHQSCFRRVELREGEPLHEAEVHGAKLAV